MHARTAPIFMKKLSLRGDHITLAQALKVAGLADTGGQAKLLVRAGVVTVNDVVTTQPGRKLVSGDRFRVQGGEEWTVSR
jgi:ribosome-associated protein